MKATLVLVVSIVYIVADVPSASAQKAPEAGYVFPPGGKAGATVEVRLGGYDWTPDMEYVVHDKRVQLSITGQGGPILIPPPPYWFGAKGRIVALPLPREVPAKFVIPADVAPGPVYWQAANANGGTSAGVFIVGSGPEVVEDENRKGPQLLAGLPMTVSGRLMKNEEIDRYRFVAPKDGPVTCELRARRLGAKFLGVLEVRDGKGALVADVAGAGGGDPSLTFAARAGIQYTVSIHDIDFGGDRSYVYRLTVTPGPRVVGAIPAAGKHGETREVEFVGYGLATGAPKLETIKQRVTFPAAGTSFNYQVETPFGKAPPFPLFLSDLSEIVSRSSPARQTGPTGITGILNQPDKEDRYTFQWKKGEIWSLSLEARRLGSPLDVAFAILGPDGKEVAHNDDLPETTDAGLDFAVPADGLYTIVVSDMAGKSGSPAAIYRLAVRQATADFALQVAAQKVGVDLGGKFDVPVKAIRRGGFKGPIMLAVQDLPVGVAVPAKLIIPEGKNDLVIPMTAAADASPSAGLVTITGTAQIGTKAVTSTALAPITLNQSPRSPEENRLGTVLIVSTMKPRFKGQPVDQDTGRKVHQGSTFPADVIVQRLEGFQGEITLLMAAQQSYQVQGITGGEVKVPPGVTKTIYPCYMPEWLESTRTSRMGMIAIAKVADPKGKVRYLVNDITGFITMTMEGPLLKVSAEQSELRTRPGQPFDVNLKISRLTKLNELVRLELRLPDELAGKFKAEPVMVPVGKEHAVVRITPLADLPGVHAIVIRGTAMQDGRYPAISEANFSVEFLPAKPPRK
ncbi:MAG TPA: hypothetical protein VKE98_21260 [Gemmataceae bacterium]|nr:hypothetical protein [Gemmataceae bacterium]